MNAPEPTITPLPRLAPRRADSHKGDYGRVLVVGGSQGMAGAVALAGMAALRSGAGLVNLAVPAVIQPTVAAFEPALMTAALDGDADGRFAAAAAAPLLEMAAEATVVALGPGLGRSEPLVELVGRLYQEVRQPMIVDADGLNALARRPAVLAKAAGPRVLTPHPGEFQRLSGRYDAGQREALARELARASGAVVVLKGHRTVICDAAQTALNATGNPAMATGGTGDVLTGIVAALLAQGLAPFDAARLAAHVHGLAGDLAAAELGEVSMIASDLVRYLPTAWQLCAAAEA